MSSKFQQRHYIAIAQVLAKHETSRNPSDATIAALVMSFVQMFKADNPKFDREKFYAAVWRKSKQK